MNKSLERFAQEFAHQIRTDRNGKLAIDNETQYGDGYWVYLKDGLIFDNDTHIVHEYSIKALRDSMKRVAPCNCQTCVKALRDRYEPFGYSDPAFPYDPFGESAESITRRVDRVMSGIINRSLYLDNVFNLDDLLFVLKSIDSGLTVDQSITHLERTIYQLEG
jgi:hypothetical protein